MKISKGSISDSRDYVLNLIKTEKEKNSNYRVIDIGGVVNGWTRSFADFVVDINSVNSDTSLSIDICIESHWDLLFEVVKKQGKFDYCICTHTLEDLYNPFSALKFIPQIANKGIITMPDASTELSRIENSGWLGYIHHRWIFDSIDEKMLIVPKLNFLESIVKESFQKNPTEIRYEWENEIPFDVFMNNYLGPNVKTVINEYTTLINRL
jgi:hypothetical protein